MTREVDMGNPSTTQYRKELLTHIYTRFALCSCVLRTTIAVNPYRDKEYSCSFSTLHLCQQRK
jgi:hypothetical protein